MGINYRGGTRRRVDGGGGRKRQKVFFSARHSAWSMKGARAATSP